MPKQKRKMISFTIDEISAVDRPAQEGAKMVLLKRQEDENMTDKVTDEAVETIAKRYIDPAEGAKSFSDILVEEMKARNYYELMETVSPYLYSMEVSLRSIAGDSTVDPMTKLSMMRNTVEDFMSVIRQMWNGDDSMDGMVMSIMNKFETEENEMAAKTVKELEAQVTDLQKKLAEAEKAAKSASDNNDNKEVETLKSQVEELTKQAEAEKAEKEELAAKADMSDDEKEFMRSLGKEDRMAFMGMTPKQRKARMKKSDEDDETITLKSGKVVRKSSVGADAFAAIQAQAEEMEALSKQAKADRDARERAEFVKRAADDFGNLPGTEDEKVDVLKAIYSIEDEKSRTHLEKMLKAGDAAMTSAFKPLGHKGAKTTDSRTAKNAGEHSFTKRVDEIVSTDRISRTAAMQKARRLYPDEFEDYSGRDERQDA